MYLTTNTLIFRCEPFPTYPRTYDLLHADGLLSHLSSERCSTIDLFLEMDRILRPEVCCDGGNIKYYPLIIFIGISSKVFHSSYHKTPFKWLFFFFMKPRSSFLRIDEDFSLFRSTLSFTLSFPIESKMSLLKWRYLN